MEEYYKEAKKIVKKKKSFYGNFTSWLIMSIFFFVLNMTTGAHFHWWIFPVLGWGIGVAYQYVDTFGVFNSKNWEKNEIEKEMSRLYSKDRYKANKEGLSLDEIPNREALNIPDFEELKREWDDQEYV